MFLKKKAIKLIFKSIMFFGFILLIANIMWLYYNIIGGFLLKIINKTEIPLEDYENIIGENYIYKKDSSIFTYDCDIPDGGYGSFKLNFNRICLDKNTQEKYVINHELVHYFLRNMSYVKKINLIIPIKTLQHKIQNIDIHVNYNNLNQDDLQFYNILKNHILKYAEDEVYNFYNWFSFFVIYHRGNEEFVTYAIGSLIKINQKNQLIFENFNLQNTYLKEIYNLYYDIYKEILILYPFQKNKSNFFDLIQKEFYNYFY